MKRTIGIAFVVLVFCATMTAQTSKTYKGIHFGWNNPTPTTMPVCTNPGVDAMNTTPTNCPANTVTCSSNQLLVETDPTFAQLKSVVSQTIAPTANSFDWNQAPTVGSHSFLLVATGRTASGAQCISGPATTSVIVPPDSTTPPPPTGQTLPPRTGLSVTLKQ